MVNVPRSMSKVEVQSPNPVINFEEPEVNDLGHLTQDIGN
jgi:hypothetical protein